MFYLEDLRHPYEKRVHFLPVVKHQPILSFFNAVYQTSGRGVLPHYDNFVPSFIGAGSLLGTHFLQLL